jgi:hypothetical protein
LDFSWLAQEKERFAFELQMALSSKKAISDVLNKEQGVKCYHFVGQF